MAVTRASSRVVVVVAGELGAHAQVLLDRHAAEDAPPFRRQGEAEAGDLVRRQLRDVLPVEHDASRVRARIAEDGHHQRRLAGAVGADHA